MQFRTWATKVLDTFTKQGYVPVSYTHLLEDKRLELVGYYRACEPYLTNDMRIAINNEDVKGFGALVSRLTASNLSLIHIFLRNCDGLNVSDKSFKVLKFDNNRITLEEEL